MATRKIRGDFELSLSAGDDAMAMAMAPGETLSVAEPVKAFLNENIEETPATDLELISEVATPAHRVVRFQRLRDGIPIVDSNVIVQVDESNHIRQIDLGDAPREVASTPAIFADDGAGTNKLTPANALEIAMSSVDGSPRMELPEPKEVYLPVLDVLRLSYLILLPTADPEPHDWRVVVDAFTGEILQRRDLIVSINGSGLVFDPNPVVTANNATFRDPAATVGTCGFTGTTQATIDAQRVTRTLRDITLTGSTHRLEGPFVRIRNFGPPVTVLPAEASATNFNYPSNDVRFEATNVYYHVDTAQRYIQSLGITTAHNRLIECDPHENNGNGNGAWFSPLDRGLHFGDSGPCNPDRAEDGHVMFHEYGHAIQNDQVRGWGARNPATGREETRAVGEGFGDIFACVFFSDHGGGFMREVFEPWIFGNRPLGGLRRVDGNKIYPGSWAHQEHADGEIWSSALWNIFRDIGGSSAVAADRQDARDSLLKTVILSHHLIAADGTMPDAAEAVMDTNASLDDYRGLHLIPMLTSFHDRGLLPSSPGVDLHIRRGAGDTGTDPFAGAVGNSPDLWIRNANDNGTTHQDPRAGQDNWFHARVRNRGTQAARAFVATFNVKTAGATNVFPGDFLPFVSAGVGYDLAAGRDLIVKAKWPAALIPAAGSTLSWLSAVTTPVDVTPAGRNVAQHNNLAQKNLTVV